MSNSIFVRPIVKRLWYSRDNSRIIINSWLVCILYLKLSKKLPQRRYLGQSGNIIFHQRLSSINDRLPSKVILHQRSSSIKVIFHQRSSSVKGRLPSLVLFHQRSPFIKGRLKGHLPSEVIFHQRLSSIKGRLP